MDLMYCRDSEEPNSWAFESLKESSRFTVRSCSVKGERVKPFAEGWQHVASQILRWEEPPQLLLEVPCPRCRRTVRPSSTKPVSSGSSRAGAWTPCRRICVPPTSSTDRGGAEVGGSYRLRCAGLQGLPVGRAPTAAICGFGVDPRIVLRG